ncbi:MAG: hypothetical protein R3Y40_03140 [Eubacteriales bacterium]
MNKMKGNSIGISLILVVFILLCLITFGTLSYLLSSADNDMSITTAENVIDFYEADMLAQEKLQILDGVLEEIYEESKSREAYLDEIEESLEIEDIVSLEICDGDIYLIFQTTVSDVEILLSEIEICYPVEEQYYRIESWTLENISSLSL